MLSLLLFYKDAKAMKEVLFCRKLFSKMAIKQTLLSFCMQDICYL